ncbi:HDIG domain-containing metalloprotein [Sinanaerobacter chloroacetimidivorans]|jgi:putative nucleotidyltransferase with HDIG domain|uniref:HDIG domain-containing protein n=1 Tax=Sinanaerobacter chloroacetimidivorans TaxID=2818044 RepID=A0A8J7W516_9FIRM|nr:HDIG domain-containing metalloprotein [Sinanaerobacter chloroacetimidivorans]MBR0599161.1 HDIG domain-containing protein [Sinanaerobacter chloroacetimidivorans]
MSQGKKLFEQMDFHLMEDDAPSCFLNGIEEEIFYTSYPFTFISRLKEVPQSPLHHPEGNVWNHTMLVVDEAARIKEKSKDKRAFMWAALLHDIGKADTTRNRKGKITAYDHDKVGTQQAVEFLKFFNEKEDFIEKTSKLIRWHMQILFVVKSLKFADIASMKRDTDIEEIALLGYCDRMGRTGADREAEEGNIESFLHQCKEIR